MDNTKIIVISSIEGIVGSTGNGNNDILIVLVTSTTKLVIDAKGETEAVKIGIGEETTIGVFQGVKRTNDAKKTKGLLIYHVMDTTIDSSTKPVKGTTTSLTILVDEDVDKKVMIPSLDVEIIKRVCDKSKGIRET